MNPERQFGAGALVALVGLVLLIVEVVRTLGSNTLGSAGAVLLWVGVGLVAAGAVVLTLAVAQATDDGRRPELDDAQN